MLLQSVALIDNSRRRHHFNNLNSLGNERILKPSMLNISASILMDLARIHSDDAPLGMDMQTLYCIGREVSLRVGIDAQTLY
jgi:hypothetical protein